MFERLKVQLLVLVGCGLLFLIYAFAPANVAIPAMMIISFTMFGLAIWYRIQREREKHARANDPAVIAERQARDAFNTQVVDLLPEERVGLRWRIVKAFAIVAVIIAFVVGLQVTRTREFKNATIEQATIAVVHRENGRNPSYTYSYKMSDGKTVVGDQWTSAQLYKNGDRVEVYVVNEGGARIVEAMEVVDRAWAHVGGPFFFFILFPLGFAVADIVRLRRGHIRMVALPKKYRNARRFKSDVLATLPPISG